MHFNIDIEEKINGNSILCYESKIKRGKGFIIVEYYQTVIFYKNKYINKKKKYRFYLFGVQIQNKD